jgi:hypothetical protein
MLQLHDMAVNLSSKLSTLSPSQVVLLVVGSLASLAVLAALRHRLLEVVWAIAVGLIADVIVEMAQHAGLVKQVVASIYSLP